MSISLSVEVVKGYADKVRALPQSAIEHLVFEMFGDQFKCLNDDELASYALSHPELFTATAAPKSARKSSGKRTRTDPAVLAEVKTAVLAAIGKCPGGKVGWIIEETKADGKVVKAALKVLREENKIVTAGEKSKMTYSLASAF